MEKKKVLRKNCCRRAVIFFAFMNTSDTDVNDRLQLLLFCLKIEIFIQTKVTFLMFFFHQLSTVKETVNDSPLDISK